MALHPRSTRTLRFFDDQSRYVDKFGWLLCLSGTAVILLALIDLDVQSDTARWSVVAVTCMVAATLSLALRTSGMTRLWQRIVDTMLVLGAAGITLVALLAATGSAVTVRAAPVATVLLAAAAPPVVVRRLLRHHRVTRGTLFGAISAYLLIALTFFYTFLAIEESGQVPFFGGDQPTTSFMYFSLTTITTLGYGDLAAQTEFARLLATTEAVLGQVYLVTVVAMVVGLLAQNWSDQGAAAHAHTTASTDQTPGPSDRA